MLFHVCYTRSSMCNQKPAQTPRHVNKLDSITMQLWVQDATRRTLQSIQHVAITLDALREEAVQVWKMKWLAWKGWIPEIFLQWRWCQQSCRGLFLLEGASRSVSNMFLEGHNVGGVMDKRWARLQITPSKCLANKQVGVVVWHLTKTEARVGYFQGVLFVEINRFLKLGTKFHRSRETTCLTWKNTLCSKFFNNAGLLTW